MTDPADLDDLDALPTFNTKAGGPLSDAQREISDKALLYAEAGPITPGNHVLALSLIHI